MRRIETRHGFLAFLFLVISVGLVVAQRAWILSYERGTEAQLQKWAHELESAIVSDHPIYESTYKAWISERPEIAYFAFANFRSGYRTGILNTTLLTHSAPELVEFSKTYGDEETLRRLMQRSGGFPGEYLTVLSFAYVPGVESAEKTPLGVWKVGYVWPGYPFGRGHAIIVWGIAGVFFLAASMVLLAPIVSSGRSSEDFVPLEHSSSAEDFDPDLAALEDETLSTEQQIVLDEQQREWIVLFNGRNLKGWTAKGEWYVVAGEIHGQPWGSSLVLRSDHLGANWILRLEAKRMAGADGFIVLFPCGDYHLAWVFGGWKGKHSEVGGYPDTRTEIDVNLNDWVQLEVTRTAEHIEGKVNGDVRFRLLISAVDRSSPDVGFQSGIGLATWSALAKFRNILLYAS